MNSRRPVLAAVNHGQADRGPNYLDGPVPGRGRERLRVPRGAGIPRITTTEDSL